MLEIAEAGGAGRSGVSGTRLPSLRLRVSREALQRVAFSEPRVRTLEVFDHPRVAVGGPGHDCQVSAVGRWDAPRPEGSGLVPERSGFTREVHIEQRRALSGVKHADEEAFAIRAPVHGIDARPALHLDLAFELSGGVHEADAVRLPARHEISEAISVRGDVRIGRGHGDAEQLPAFAL